MTTASIIPPVPELIPVLVRTKQRSIRHINLIAPEYYAPNGWYESGLLEGTLKSKKPSTNPENVKHTLIPPEDAKKRDYRCLQNLMHRRPRPNHLRSLDVTLTEAHRSLVTAAALVIANARSLSQIFITGIYSKNGSFNHADASILMTIDTMKQAFARSDSSAYKIPERISLCCVDTLTYHLSQFLSVIDCNNLRSLRFSKCPTAATSLLSGCKYLTGLTELIFDLSGTVKTIQQCLLAIVPNLETLVITTKGSSEHCITAEPIIRHANKLRRIWLEVALEDGQLLSLPAQPSNNDDPSFTWSHVANILNLEELCAPLYHEIPQEIIKGTYVQDPHHTLRLLVFVAITNSLSSLFQKCGCSAILVAPRRSRACPSLRLSSPMSWKRPLHRGANRNFGRVCLSYLLTVETCFSSPVLLSTFTSSLHHKHFAERAPGCPKLPSRKPNVFPRI